jgi:hypothetical protein
MNKQPHQYHRQYLMKAAKEQPLRQPQKKAAAWTQFPPLLKEMEQLAPRHILDKR